MRDYEFDKEGIPERMQGGIERYIEQGKLPGSFLTAVICNDLKEACAMADDENQKLLFNYVRWFYNYAPSQCWGSKEKMERWILDFHPGGCRHGS